MDATRRHCPCGLDSRLSRCPDFPNRLHVLTRLPHELEPYGDCDQHYECSQSPARHCGGYELGAHHRRAWRRHLRSPTRASQTSVHIHRATDKPDNPQLDWPGNVAGRATSHWSMEFDFQCGESIPDKQCSSQALLPNPPAVATTTVLLNGNARHRQPVVATGHGCEKHSKAKQAETAVFR